MLDLEENRRLVEKAVYLYKIAFSNSAQSCNAKVRYVSQHSILWGAMGKDGFSSAYWLGICAGLALEWIKANNQNRDLIQDLLTARNDVFFKKPDSRLFLSEIVKSIEDSHKLQNTLKKALSGICSPAGNNISSTYPFNNACSKMKTGNYYYISSGSHAMAAIYRSRNKLDFYDPNVGEMRGITKNALQNYLKAAVEGSCIAQNMSVKSLIGTKKISVIGFR